MDERTLLRRLKKFLSPRVLELLATCDDEEWLAFHEREIAVVFCDLRGFTTFAHGASSAELVAVLDAYHRGIGPIIARFGGILERFTGDGVMVYFDDASPDEQACRAVRMAVAMRDRVGALAPGWRRRGWALDVGLGIALGPATLGPIGFDQRRDFAAIGPVTNLASRLCAAAAPGQVLVTDRVREAVRGVVAARPLGDRRLKGFEAPVRVHAVDAVALRSEALEYASAG